MTKFIFAFIVTFISLNAAAYEKHAIQFGGWSYHYLSSTYTDENGERQKYNQSHNRIGWYGDYGQDWAEAGTFVNSYGKRSFYAVKGIKMIWKHDHYLGLSGGLVSGYTNTEAHSAIFIALNGGYNITRNFAVDGMLGWGQANMSFRFNF